jgi:hypothetical protein
MYTGRAQSWSFVNNVIMWTAADKQWGMSWDGPYLPNPNRTSVLSLVRALHESNRSALPYMSQWFHTSRNASEYVARVADWKEVYSIDGIYTDGLAEDDWTSAYEAMRLLRTTFGAAGTLIVHDTIQEVGASPAEYRPFIHAYSTATLMGEGESSAGVGQDWSWPRYCTSQFRKSNAFGAVKGTAWSGPGISPPAAPVNQDLVSLVYNGRDRPGQAGFSTVYLKALHTLESLWHSHGRLPDGTTPGTFYDQYYLPAAQNCTGMLVGRSPMPVATVTRLVVRLATHQAFQGVADVVRYTVDGTTVTATSPVYSAPFGAHGGTTVRAKVYRGALAPSRELVVSVRDE